MPVDADVSTEREAYFNKLRKGLEPTGVLYQVPYKSNRDWTKLRVYEVPMGNTFETRLRFNLYNTRIEKHVKAARAEGKELDPEKEGTQDFVRDILLNDKFYSKNAAKNLEDDLRNSGGQREPAIISCDGTVWNGNRRMAVISELFRKTGDPQWSKIKGVFLPRLTKKELRQMEYRLQVANDFKEDYDRLTLFLLCRERMEVDGWSPEELEFSFRRRYKKRQIMEFVKIINIIDEYLERIGRPHAYPSIGMKEGAKGVEFFTNIQSHVEYEKNNLGTDAVEIGKIKSEFFSAFGHGDATYMDARSLSSILKNDNARSIYLTNSKIYKDYATYTRPGPDKKEKTFDPDTANAVLKNIRNTYAEMKSTEADTPFDLAEKALKKLLEIKAEDVDPDDLHFTGKLDEISDAIKRLNPQA